MPLKPISGDLFVDVFSEPAADTNSDGAISLLEAFLRIQNRVDEWYAQDGALQAEHPHLDDNGDGRASRKELEDSGEGTVAEKTFFRQTPHPTSIIEQPDAQDSPETEDVAPAPHTHENGQVHAEDTSETPEQTGTKGKSSLPYDFISEEDAQIIQALIENAPPKANQPKRRGYRSYGKRKPMTLMRMVSTSIPHAELSKYSVKMGITSVKSESLTPSEQMTSLSITPGHCSPMARKLN